MRFKEVFHVIEEKRRSLPTSNVEELSKYKHDPMMFVSFTNNKFGEKSTGVKLGINPLTRYDTPVGIYSYPIKAMWNGISKGAIPFAGENPNMYIFEPKNPDRVAVGSEYETIDFDRDYHKLIDIMIPILQEVAKDSNRDYKNVYFFGRYANYIMRETKKAGNKDLVHAMFNSRELYEKHVTELLKDPKNLRYATQLWLDQMMDLVDASYKNTPIQQIWSLTRQISIELQHHPKFEKGKQISNWANILFKLYDGFVDDLGQGFIHTNEPKQAVFFTGAVVNVVDLISRKRTTREYSREHLLRDPQTNAKIFEPLFELYRDMQQAAKDNNGDKFAELFAKFVNYRNKFPQELDAGSVKDNTPTINKFEDNVQKIFNKLDDPIIKYLHKMPLDLIEKITSQYGHTISNLIDLKARSGNIGKYRKYIIALIRKIFNASGVDGFDMGSAIQFASRVIREVGQMPLDESDYDIFDDDYEKKSKNAKHTPPTADTFNKFIGNLNDLSLAALKGAASGGSEQLLGRVLKNLGRQDLIKGAINRVSAADDNAYAKIKEGNPDYVYLASDYTDPLRESKHFMTEFFKIVFKNVPHTILEPEDSDWPKGWEVTENMVPYTRFLSSYVGYKRSFKPGLLMTTGGDVVAQIHGNTIQQLYKKYDDILFNFLDNNLESGAHDDKGLASYAEQILLRRHQNTEYLAPRIMNYAAKRIRMGYGAETLKNGKYSDPSINRYIERKEEEYKLNKEEEAKDKANGSEK